MEEVLLVNPRRRKRRSHRRSRARRARSHRRTRRASRGGYRIRRRRLRNPRMRLPSVRGIMGEVTPAVIGAAGALALDVGMAYAPLPASLQSGWMKTLAQLGGALLLGFIAAKVPFVGRRNAQIGTLGALTVIAYNAIRPLAADALGSKVKGLSGLADFGDFSAYQPSGMGAYMNPAPLLSSPIKTRQMGAYMSRGLSGTYSGDMF